MVLSDRYSEEICEAGLAAGLDRVGIASAEPFDATRRILEQRRSQGLAASMQFTYRNPERSTNPAHAMPTVASLVVGARRYDRSVVPSPSQDRPMARVARYATDDHYGQLRAGLDAVAARLSADGWMARVVLDDNALVDRAAAHRAGLGWYGKNANVLIPGIGSWVVLGSVLTDAPLPHNDDEVPDGCGSCTRCIDGCPTSAIIGPGVVDARRCLAWLVQAEGVFPIEYREALGDRIYGCDECQEVCPPSRRPLLDPDQRDPGPHAQSGSWVDVLEMLATDDAELLARFGRWYIPRREPRYLRRNAFIVLGNSATLTTPGVTDALERGLADTDPIVRSHAVWAARRLGLDPLPPELRFETDPMVRAELDRAVTPRSVPHGSLGLPR